MNDDLKKAQDNLNKFLKENPHMEEYQAKIERILKHLKDPKQRMQILLNMTVENLEKLKEINEVLKKALKSIT